MTADPLAAVLDQLAAQRERITRLDTREAGHFAGLAGLLGLTVLADADPAPDDAIVYQPDPASAWWLLSPSGSRL